MSLAQTDQNTSSEKYRILMSPQFTVIMPAFNASTTIKDAIESALDQTFTNFELIIVNDCSNDSTLQIAREYQNRDERIKVINLKSNEGVAAARNHAIRCAKGTYMTFLDSDDIWLPKKLEIQKNYFNRGNDVVFSAYFRFYSNGKEKLVEAPHYATYNALLRGNFIGNLTAAYNASTLGKELQKSIGHEDYLMWLKIIQRSKRNIGIPIPLAKYRVQKDSLSSNYLKSAGWMWNIYRNHLNFSRQEALSKFISYTFHAIKKRF